MNSERNNSNFEILLTRSVKTKESKINDEETTECRLIKARLLLP
jgi:hypothetical protein